MHDEALTPLLEQVIDPAQPLCEWEGWRWAQRCAGVSRPRWRARALQAQGLAVEASEDPLSPEWQQILVHAGPQRQAFLRACQRSWQALPLGGRLLMCGANRFGVRASVRRLAKEWQHPISTDISGQHGRVMVISKTADTPGQAIIPWISWQDASGMTLQAPPGVFAAGRIDRGAAVLLQALEQAALPSLQQIADLGCGSGILGLTLLRRFPQAQLHAADGDDLACAATTASAVANACAERVSVHWWDSSEALPAPITAEGADLVVCNPPWHEDGSVDRSAGLAMVEQALAACAPGGHCYLVATRTQPFESMLPAGHWQEVYQADGFKVLRVHR